MWISVVAFREAESQLGSVQVCVQTGGWFCVQREQQLKRPEDKGAGEWEK